VGAPDSVEFLTQNEIEQFAISQDRLTNAIYTRLERLDADERLASAEKALKEELDRTEELGRLLDDEQQLVGNLAAVESERATNQNLINSLEDPAYVDLTAERQAAANEQTQRRAARSRLNELITNVVQLVNGNELERVRGNAEPYEGRRTTLIADLRAAIERARDGLDLTRPDAREQELVEAGMEAESRLQRYLSERNISAENVTDISRAGARLAELNERREALSRDLQANRVEQAAVQLSDTALPAYEEELLANVGPINERLQQMGLEVQRISLRYRFDTDAAKDGLLQDLVELLAPFSDGGRAPRVDHIGSALSGIDILRVPAKADLIAALGQAASQSKTVQLLLDYFQDDFNYRRFVLCARRRAMDALSFRRLSVLYDGRPLQNASFGQRCSAALILLLTIGNTPIVIDEPEAHLDSALIADLLVLLIKRVKSDRQIIFATHNANFVVNGDAELIHILDMDANRHSAITSSTLENRDHRPRVPALEGGEKAFQQREGRYGMRTLLD
jgi:hypothetical protein